MGKSPAACTTQCENLAILVMTRLEDESMTSNQVNLGVATPGGITATLMTARHADIRWTRVL
jgi:hypothetical protein